MEDPSLTGSWRCHAGKYIAGPKASSDTVSSRGRRANTDPHIEWANLPCSLLNIFNDGEWGLREGAIHLTRAVHLRSAVAQSNREGNRGSFTVHVISCHFTHIQMHFTLHACGLWPGWPVYQLLAGRKTLGWMVHESELITYIMPVCLHSAGSSGPLSSSLWGTTSIQAQLQTWCRAPSIHRTSLHNTQLNFYQQNWLCRHMLTDRDSLTSFNTTPPDPPGLSAGGTAHGKRSRRSQNAVCWLRDSALPGGGNNNKSWN